MTIKRVYRSNAYSFGNYSYVALIHSHDHVCCNQLEKQGQALKLNLILFATLTKKYGQSLQAQRFGRSIYKYDSPMRLKSIKVSLSLAL